MIELFGSTTSPFVRHCRMAFKQTQQDFQLQLVDYSTSAQDSPMKKVPYLKDDLLTLTDSSSILMYIRQKAGSTFPASVQDFELFTMANTVADTAINLFLLNKDGITSKQSNYIIRQSERLATGFQALNNAVNLDRPLDTDGQIRVACLTDWILFRELYDLNPYPVLTSLVTQANTDHYFMTTDPRQHNSN